MLILTPKLQCREFYGLASLKETIFLPVYKKAAATLILNLGKRQIISVYLTIIFQSQQAMPNGEQQ